MSTLTEQKKLVFETKSLHVSFIKGKTHRRFLIERARQENKDQNNDRERVEVSISEMERYGRNPVEENIFQHLNMKLSLREAEDLIDWINNGDSFKRIINPNYPDEPQE